MQRMPRERVMERDPSYSPDVEIDEKGRVVFARDVGIGETIAVPMHMVRLLQAQKPVQRRVE